MSTPQRTPSYEELCDENARLKQQLADLTRSSAANTTDSSNDPRFNADMNHFSMYHNLSKKSIERYSRHLILKNIGVQAQEKWLKSSVLVIGAGGLGSPLLLYLVGAGVGRITLIDHDVVDESNLHRQVIHGEDMVGKYKVDSAMQVCKRLNSQVNIIPIYDSFTPENALELCADHDIVVDCTDNVATRYLASDACVYTNKPLISAAVVGLNGQLTNYCLDDGPCYRCVNPVPPPASMVQNCSDSGVFGPLVGVVGTMQALEALKVLAKVKQLPPSYVSTKQQEQQQQDTPLPHNDIVNPSWPPLEPTQFVPLNGQMIFWDAVTSTIRTAKIRPRQATCMCSQIRPQTNSTPSPYLHQLADISLSEVEWSCSTGTQKPSRTETAPTSSSPSQPDIRPVRTHASLLDEITTPVQKLDNSDDKPRMTIATPFHIVDVRVTEQFQIACIPSSIHCAYNVIHTKHWVIRDLLWRVFAQLFPHSIEEYRPTPAEQERIRQIDLETDAKVQARLRRQTPPLPPYQLTQETIHALFHTETPNEASDVEIPIIRTTADLNTHIASCSALPHPSAQPCGDSNPSETGPSSPCPVLPLAFLCRRGVLSLYILKYISSTMQSIASQQQLDSIPSQYNLPHDVIERTLAGEPSHTTLSLQYARLAVLAQYPPIIATDLAGGLTEYAKTNEMFPIY